MMKKIFKRFSRVSVAQAIYEQFWHRLIAKNRCSCLDMRSPCQLLFKQENMTKNSIEQWALKSAHNRLRSSHKNYFNFGIFFIRLTLDPEPLNLGAASI